MTESPLCRSPPPSDYKRIFDGDEGPNTGGMGSFSPVATGIDDARTAEICAPPCTSRCLTSSPGAGPRFTACSTPGLMLTPDGPRVLEFNVRFGDPETQAILPRLRTDLLALLRATATAGGLAGVIKAGLDWDPRTAVTVVLASAGYPRNRRAAAT